MAVITGDYLTLSMHWSTLIVKFELEIAAGTAPFETGFTRYTRSGR